MTNFTYNRDIPNPPNNPSQDVPSMKINTNSIDDLIAVDHYSFNVTNGGLHKQVQMPSIIGVPPGLISNTTNLYANAANGASQLFYTNGTSGNGYQLTRSDNANFGTFGTYTSYGPPPAGFTQDGGWTFLPGGLLFQYGFFGKVGDLGGSGTIKFPVAFSPGPTNGVFSISMILYRNSASANSVLVLDTTGSPTISDFKFIVSNSTSSDGIYWTAIGK